METDNYEIKVKADYREKGSGIIELLRNRGIEPEVAALAYGDYVINGAIAAERKTASDFVSSLISGRLFRQVSVLKLRSPHPLIIIEGNPYKTRDGGSQKCGFGRYCFYFSDMGYTDSLLSD